MFNKTNTQTHHGIGNQYIDQGVTNNIFITYKEPAPENARASDWTPVFGFAALALLGLGKFILTVIKQEQGIILASQITLLVIVNLYVYHKSKDKKLLIEEVTPSLLAVMTTYFSINNKLPTDLQSILESVSTNPNTASFQSFFESIISNSLFHILSELIKHPTNDTIFVIVYIILILLIITSPLSIAFNAFIRKSIRNYPTYLLIGIYWLAFAWLSFFR